MNLSTVSPVVSPASGPLTMNNLAPAMPLDNDGGAQMAPGSQGGGDKLSSSLVPRWDGEGDGECSNSSPAHHGKCITSQYATEADATETMTEDRDQDDLLHSRLLQPLPLPEVSALNSAHSTISDLIHRLAAVSNDLSHKNLQNHLNLTARETAAASEARSQGQSCSIPSAPTANLPLAQMTDILHYINACEKTRDSTAPASAVGAPRQRNSIRNSCSHPINWQLVSRLTGRRYEEVSPLPTGEHQRTAVDAEETESLVSVFETLCSEFVSTDNSHTENTGDEEAGDIEEEDISLSLADFRWGEHNDCEEGFTLDPEIDSCCSSVTWYEGNAVEEIVLSSSREPSFDEDDSHDESGICPDYEESEDDKKA